MPDIISFLESVQRGMEDNIFNFTKDGKCSGCGNCCSNLLPMSRKEVATIHRYIKKHRVEECVHLPPTKESVHDMTCPFRDNGKSICTVYEVRPEICKQFICDSEKRVKHNRELLKQTRNIINVRSEFF